MLTGHGHSSTNRTSAHAGGLRILRAALMVVLALCLTWGGAFGATGRMCEGHCPIGGETAIAAATIAPLCGADDGAGAPPFERAHDALCCLACSSGGRDQSALFGLPPAVTQAADPPDAPTSITILTFETSGPEPVGWATSWSSRAPPAPRA